MNEIINDRYVLVRKIGDGGMADVYLAMDSVLNREVAIKILRGELSLDPVSLLRFQREAHAASEISHPNIVEIFDVGEDNGKHFIVMEYIRGITLKQLIVKRGGLEKEEAVSIMKQVASGVVVAHQHGIVHRDIKPQNIMIKDDGSIKIMDFGIAIAGDALQLTQIDSVMGSVHYLAPECGRGEVASAQSDIYSMGIVFYEILTGSVPFRGDTPVQIAMKHMKDEMPLLKSFNPTMPNSLENIVIRATAKNRMNRYPDAQAFLDDLSTALDRKRADEAVVEFAIDDDENRTIMFNPNNDLDRPKPKKHDIGRIILISIISIAILISSIFVYLVFNPSKSEIIYTIPTVIGMNKDEAVKAITDAGFAVEIMTGSSEYEKDKVYKTLPEAGVEKTQKGYTVTLYISSGKTYVVEDFTGMKIDEARAILSALSDQNIMINVSEIKIADSTKEAGVIISQKSLTVGMEVVPNTTRTITFEVATNVSFIIPNVINANIDQAYQTLTNLGAVVEKEVISTEGMTDEEINLLQKNVVVSVDPGIGSDYEQTKDAKITLRYYE